MDVVVTHGAFRVAAILDLTTTEVERAAARGLDEWLAISETVQGSKRAPRNDVASTVPVRDA